MSSLKESESSALADSKSMSGELADMRLELERLRYDGKEQAITTDSLKEQNAELERELEELRVSSGSREVARILLRLTYEDFLVYRGPCPMPSRRKSRWTRTARTRRRPSGWPP